MSQLDEQIQRFANMAEADPNNELGHFSLGKALLEASRYDEAIPSLERVIKLNDQYSKAYELLARAQLALHQETAAIGTLKRGFVVAAKRGDVMVERALESMLKDLGQALPQVERKAAPAAGAATVDDATFRCRRCGATEGKMEERPFKGPTGEKIHQEICAACWREWVLMGTKVINELSLQLANPESQKIYDQYMAEFLQIEIQPS